VNIGKTEHIPVLAGVLTEQIVLPQDAVMVDATIGQGGHSILFGRNLGPEGVIVGLDVDRKAIQGAQTKLTDLICKLVLIEGNFGQISDVLGSRGINKVDFILADLGVCSAQLTDPEIGLSFQANMPLDMRMDKRLTTTAADIVNTTDQNSLADLIYKFGEDRAARRIARFIVEGREQRPIATTGQLAMIVCRALGPGRKGRIHPATRTFQALRIAVNNELENLKKLLAAAAGLMKKDGRIAVISFHSLEDRLVKNSFRENKEQGIYTVVTKKPLRASREEIAENPRARSAKLRIAQKR